MSQTVKRLKEALAYCKSNLEKLESADEQRWYSQTFDAEASMHVVLYEKEVVDPLIKLVEAAESAAQEAASEERASLLAGLTAAILKSKAGDFSALTELAEALAASDSLQTRRVRLGRKESFDLEEDLN
jgi:hypothetical protein